MRNHLLATEGIVANLIQLCRFSSCTQVARILVVLLCLGAFSTIAVAHDQSFPIGADGVLVHTNTGLFEFNSSDSANLPSPSSPVSGGSALLIRGTGANALRTPLLHLDESKWSFSGGEYVYSNNDSDRPGGITDIRLSGEVLEIDGSGDNWSFDPSGPLESLWVHFLDEEEWYCAEFGSGDASTNAAGHFAAGAVGDPGPNACDLPVCGNGEHEVGEECDDGNLENDDGCDNDCTIGLCTSETYDTTFEGIRKVIFEEPAYLCSTCHAAGPGASGGLALLPAGGMDANLEVHQNLVGVDGQGVYSAVNPTLKLVENSEPALSVLYLKVLKKRLEALDPGYEGPAVGAGMPTAGQKLSEAHAEALRSWIRAGAPLDGVVAGTAALLGTCLPPATPLKATPPDPPLASVGVQFRQTPWELAALAQDSNGEDEICMATYFDISGVVPEEASIECPSYLTLIKGCSQDTNITCQTDGECGEGNTCDPVRNFINGDSGCIAINYQKLVQDAQSHHSILDLYAGRSDATDPGWGEFTYKLEPTDPLYASLHGTPCDPTEIDPALGYNPGCSSAVVSSVACGGFGPSDMSAFSIQGSSSRVGIGGSQEPFYELLYPDGVYGYLPKKGMIVWNSHAFNLTPDDTTMAQYLDFEYAISDSERQNQVRGIFHAPWIFAQYIHPFETQEICATYQLPKNANLFQLSSHTHFWGNKFRIWAPPNDACQPGCPTTEETLDPNSDILTHPLVGLCSENDKPLCTGPREDEPIYYSTEYSDPLQLEFSPPIWHPSDDARDRTYLYCSQYDNGSTPTSPPVRRWSESPPTPDLGLGPNIQILIGQILGGPCRDSLLQCVGGDNEGELCGEESEGFCTGGGECDACPIHGGVTTANEMFIMLGNFYVDAVPEPSRLLLAAATIGTLSILARRRRQDR